MSTAVADPLLHPAGPASEPPARRRRRWEVWRSPDDQPAWARPALLAIAAAAAALFAWNIADAGLAPFYAVAVKSMSESWKAFFYGAFDPKATITIDKLAGSFAPQALAVRVFGFHPWSLALPQVIEGVLSVLFLYRTVRRWAGPGPGLLAASLFALTPIIASTMGHSMEDGALTFCLIVAADQWTRAVVENRLRSLLWAGFWVGAGFQCKMLQAWLVLPALVIAYLLCVSGSWGRRIRDVLLFGVVTLAVSLSWILLYTFTPAADRPYVDGSTNNSAWSMVFGYNGLERFGIAVPGAVMFGPKVKTRHGIARGVAGHAGAGGGFGSGWTKLLGSQFGPQISWLLPLVVLSLVCGLLWTWHAGRDTAQPGNIMRTGFVFWGLWFATFFLIFSDMSSIPHAAYVASLAPAMAALSAAGIVMFWRAYRASGSRGWMFPVAAALSLAWAIFLWMTSASGFLPWVLWGAMVIGAAAVTALIWARASRQTTARIATIGLITGSAAMLIPSSAWAASVLDPSYAGSSSNASAGPTGGTSHTFGGPLTGSERALYNYVNAHKDGASYLMAVPWWTEATPFILATGQEVMQMGGFRALVPEPALPKVQGLVRSGQLRFFLVNSPSGFKGHRSPPTMKAIDTWVRKTCSTVPAKVYGGTSSSSASVSEMSGMMGGGGQVLFRCGS